MMDLAGKFTKPRDLALDLLSGTCGVSKSCLLLPKNNSLVELDNDDACIEGSK